MYIAISYGSFAVAVPDLQIRGGGGGGGHPHPEIREGAQNKQGSFQMVPLNLQKLPL